MANIISNDSVDKEDYLQMSNGLTGVFIDVICLSGGEIAKYDFQKDLMIWFAQRDWMVMGRGIIGFDISDIIWDEEIFAKQKDFILEVLERSIEKKNWNLLSYSPKEDWVIIKLKGFRRMIKSFEKIHIEEDEQYELVPFEKMYGKCDKHHIFLHFGGCVICNNE